MPTVTIVVFVTTIYRIRQKYVSNKTLHLNDKHGAPRRTKTDKKDYKKAKKEDNQFYCSICL